MHKVKLTERVPQHPKSKRKDFRDKVGSDWEMLPKATFEQSNNRLLRPVCRGFSFFWPPKEHNRNNQQQISNNRTRVKTTKNTRKYVYLLYILPLNLVANRTVLLFIRTFCADRKYQRALRIGRFLNVKRSWWFLGGAKLAQLATINSI